MIIAKNCMEEIAKIYNVEIGEVFNLCCAKGSLGFFRFEENGLWKQEKGFDGHGYNGVELWYDYTDIIGKLLTGKWGIFKIAKE